MVKNTEKLAWGARGRRFESCHPDSFSLGVYDKTITSEFFLKSNHVPGMWQVMQK
jgi:hypothetical protein